MRVIVTADARRLPVFVETELVVGRARIYLSQARVLRPQELTAFRKRTALDRDESLD
jgi:hypothetical protein